MDKESLSGFTFDSSTKLSECNDVQGLSVPMSPADELFCNGRIRPMKPSALPQRTPLPNFEPQSPVISKEGNAMEEKHRGRQFQLSRNEMEIRHRSPARSLSPQRNSPSHWEGKGEGERDFCLISDSPSAFKPRGSRRTWSLIDFFLHRSKSEGREKERDEMHQLSFSSYTRLSSSVKEKKKSSAQGKPSQKKKMADTNVNRTAYISSPSRKGVPASAQELHSISSPNRRGVPASAQELHRLPSPNRRRVPVSAHELHYTANRAQAEELRKKTFLPYRQGVLGCLSFPSPPASPQGYVLQPLY